MAPPGRQSVVFFLVRIVLAVVGVPVAGAQVAVKLLRNAFSLGGSVPAVYYPSYLIVSEANAWMVAFVLPANDGAGAFVEEIILRG
jgi:hypothetical protein